MKSYRYWRHTRCMFVSHDLCMMGFATNKIHHDYEFAGYTEVFLKQCCGSAPKIWKSGDWHCNECDSIVEFEQQMELPVTGFGSLHRLPDVCECGADKVMTTHSSWCPKYNS